MHDSAVRPPAVDPWPDSLPVVWTPDPEQTVASEPSWKVQTPSWDQHAHAPVGPTRPMSPAGSAAHPLSPARPVSPGRPAAPRPSGNRPPANRPAQPGAAVRPAPRRPRQRRRTGGFLRFLQVLLSIVVLIAVPVAALVLAYSFGTGEPWQEAARDLVDQLVDLYHNRIA